VDLTVPKIGDASRFLIKKDVGRSGPGVQALGLNVQIGPERPE
jgi:hypothetical protein